jgi:hypothetical protein
MQDDIFNVIKYQGKEVNVFVYPVVQRVIDADEGTTTDTLLNPVPIKAVVSEMSPGTLKWKYWGNLPSGSIRIITEKKWYTLFLIAGKILYNGKSYYIWQDDAKRFSITNREDYILVICARKYDV